MDTKNITLSISPILPFIIGTSLVLSAIIGAYTFYAVRSFDNTLSVTGSAKQQVTSDTVKWTGMFMRTIKVSGMRSGYEQMAKDLAAVKQFLQEEGIPTQDVTIMPVTMEQVYDYQPGIDREREYTLRQMVEVRSKDVAKIAAISEKSQVLTARGVIFSTQSLEYYYSGIAELRVNLLAEALKDAQARASKLAEASGRSVGTLKSAASGVVQVLPVNSVEVSDYGAYDTTHVEKEVMVTVKAAFTLR